MNTVYYTIAQKLKSTLDDFHKQETQFSNYSFPIALTYINWETDAIVAIELIRNVSIALGRNQFRDTIIVNIN